MDGFIDAMDVVRKGCAEVVAKLPAAVGGVGGVRGSGGRLFPTNAGRV